MNDWEKPDPVVAEIGRDFSEEAAKHERGRTVRMAQQSRK